MRTLKMVLVVILAFACQAAMADSPSLNSKGPLGELQAQIDTQLLHDGQYHVVESVRVLCH